MSTFVAGRRDPGRSFTPDLFADITASRYMFVAGGIEFDADLTGAEVTAAWWRFTSRNDADETCRRNIKALRDAEADTASPLLLALADAYLGIGA